MRVHALVSRAIPSLPMTGCEVGLENLCLDDIDGSWWGVVIEVVLLFYSFVAVAIVADAHLVVSLETLCVRWSVREDVAGASFMAFGSAAPEIIINSISTIKTVAAQGEAIPGGTELGIGAIIGSGMIAFTAIPGACGVFSKEVLQLKRRPLARDITFYAMALTLLCVAFADSVIVLHEAATLLAFYALYMLVVVCSAKIREGYRVGCLGREPATPQSFVTSGSPSSESVCDPLPRLACEPLARELPLEPLTDLATLHIADPPGADMLGSQSSHTVAWLCPIICAKGFRAIIVIALEPLNSLLRLTCPACEHDSPCARWYPVTLVTSFVWIAFLSMIIAAVVSRWGDLLGVPSSFLGMYVIAIGAEIPDTIQSVTVARRGYGSMAVSNSTGSQIINILVGLGFPWFISCASGLPVPVNGHTKLQIMAYFQAANVSIYTSLILMTTLRTWRPGDHSKATLGRYKGVVLISLYIVSLSAYAVFSFAGA